MTAELPTPGDLDRWTGALKAHADTWDRAFHGRDREEGDSISTAFDELRAALPGLLARAREAEKLRKTLASKSVTRCQKCGAEALPSPTHALDLEHERDEALFEVSRLLALVSELEADKERLDWLEANTRPHRHGGIFIAVTDGLWEVGETRDCGFNGFNDGEGDTLREAIDNARASRAGEN